MNIKKLNLGKYNDSTNYESLGNGIYKDLTDKTKFNDNYRIALTIELEDGEDSQNPLEHFLDVYSLFVSDFLTSDSSEILNLELSGKCNKVEKILEIIGKRVYEKPFIDEKGKNRLKLIIQ